ncbi:MAG: hypothetical protein ACLFS7_09285, partial [Desulfosudaceae bacterium]
MLLLNPKKYQDRNYPDERSREIMLKTIEFFENKGLKKMKEDFFSFEFTYDFAEFVKKEGIFEILFLPRGYGEEDQYYSTYRMFEFSEICGFYGTAYWYMYHVSTLGLDPIFLGDNEELKQRAVQILRENPLCAFGLSEKEHGADIYSSEMKLYPQEDGTYLARGTKYYIGNGNEASTITVFGKIAGTDEYVFFVVDSHHEKYECVQNVIQAQNYVSEFILHDYPITDADISARGPKAWDDMLNTINICKFNIGSGATGIHLFGDSDRGRRCRTKAERLLEFIQQRGEGAEERLFADLRSLIQAPRPARNRQWQRAIRTIADQALPSSRWDYAMSRPNRRFIDAGIYAPGRYLKRQPLITIVVDVSGSMAATPGELEAAFGAVEELLNDYRINLLCVDQDLFVPRKPDRPRRLTGRPGHYLYQKGDWRYIQTGSRGATFFAPLFNDYLRHHSEPLLIMTDGEIYDLDALRPYFLTLWLISGERADSFRPPFGRVM